MSAGRLFVPLNSEPYRAFERGRKDVELRGYSDRFNMQTVVPGRRVELRRGYSTDDSIWGVIGHVRTFRSLSNIPEMMDHQRISPGTTETEFVERARGLVGDYGMWIAFTVVADRGGEDGE